MALKTFNIDEDVYRKFAEFCKANGISMSKQVEFFIRSQMEEPEIRPEYLKKLQRISRGKHVPFKDINDLRRQIEG